MPRPCAIALLTLLMIGGGGVGPARADDPAPFTAPKNAAAWAAARPDLHRAAEQAIAPRRRTFKAVTLVAGVRSERDGALVEGVTLDGGTSGFFVLPADRAEGAKVPLVILCPGTGRTSAAEVNEPGYDGRPNAVVLARMGFAVLTLDDAPPVVLRMALDAALARPEVDDKRVGVVGIGPGGITALGLMAVDDRVRCGYVAVEAATLARRVEEAFALDSAGDFGSATWADALAALCAPRPLGMVVGEAVPLRPDSVARRVERSVKGTYKVASPSGSGVSYNHVGEFPGHDRIDTRLPWIAALEHLDKTFRPQGPTPLGHAPEPEPELPADALELAASGIAGWAVEMAQRPGTWTWRDGVITCKPGPNEYGWLRAPVEVGDFLLRVEWRVPPRGNAGIFLRAKPVPWQFAPGEYSKLRVGALGLDWPSRTGLELQAQDDPGSANRYSSGSLYRHAAPASNPTHPPGGDWNRYTVRARGPRIEVWTNGTQVLDARIDQVPETLPHPPMRGFIGLQNHGAPAEYRNFRLVRLSDVPANSGDGRGQ